MDKIPKAIHQGAGIRIINHASESLIPNRPIHSSVEATDTNPWKTTGAKVAK